VGSRVKKRIAYRYNLLRLVQLVRF